MSHLVTELLVGALIIASVGLLLIEVSLAPGAPYRDAVVVANDAVTWVFVVELALRFLAERSKRRFFRRFWLDILSVLPLLRAFRLLRVLRLLRLFRLGAILNQHAQRASRAFGIVKLEYVFAAVLVVVVVLMGAVSIRSAEGRDAEGLASLEDALWYAVMTVAAAEPVGAEPTTRFGRMVTLALMLGGMTAFAFVAGTVSAVMIDTLKKLRFKRMDLEDLEGHVVVCGWNHAGAVFLEELLHGGKERHVVVITEKESLDEAAFGGLGSLLHVIHDDFTRASVLRQAGIERAAFAVILADEGNGERSEQDRDARTVLAAMLVERITKKRIHTTVQLMNGENEASLREAGVEDVIVSDEYVGSMMANVVKNRGMVPVIAELLTSRFGQQLFKVPVPASLRGMKASDAMVALKDRYDATLLAVELRKEDGGGFKVNPPGDLVIEEGHQLVVTAEKPPR